VHAVINLSIRLESNDIWPSVISN